MYTNKTLARMTVNHLGDVTIQEEGFILLVLAEIWLQDILVMRDNGLFEKAKKKKISSNVSLKGQLL